MEAGSGFRNPSCRGLIGRMLRLAASSAPQSEESQAFSSVKIPYEMAGSYSDGVKCQRLGSPLFHHANLMERRRVWRQRQIDKDSRSVLSIVRVKSKRGSSASQSPLTLNNTYFILTERLSHMILTHFQCTAAHENSNKCRHTVDIFIPLFSY